MSIQAVAWALDQDLPARPKLVLVSLANHANHTDGYCWLKAETIAAEAACSPRAVYRYIGALARNGYIRKAARKSDDGKQRANDYWIMFARELLPWDWGGQSFDDDGASDDVETQDVVEPTDTVAVGEPQSADPPDPVEKHALSHGPTDSGVSRYESVEPSKTKPEDARASPLGGPPRRYQPPPIAPPPPQGAIADRRTEQIFVYSGTPAYDAWCLEMARRNGVRRWALQTTLIVDGKARSGWFFPSLFPPARAGPAERPKQPADEITSIDG